MLANPPKPLRFVAISKQAAFTARQGHCRYYACTFSRRVDAMPGDYSLSDLLERIYANHLALEAALMELTLHVEQQGAPEVGENIRGALETIDENAAYIKQSLTRLGGCM
jgi:hypothetical protein